MADPERQCGVSETNDPNVSVLWERQGSVVWILPVRKDGQAPVLPPCILQDKAAQDHLKREGEVDG